MKRLSHKWRTIILILGTFIEGSLIWPAFYAWRAVKLEHEWKGNTTAMFLSGLVVLLLSIGYYLLVRAVHKELQPYIGKKLNVLLWIYRSLVFVGFVIVPIISNKVFSL